MIDIQNLERAVKNLAKYSKSSKKKQVQPKQKAPEAPVPSREELHEKRIN